MSVHEQDLLFHILNVGHGDTIIVELPRDKDGRKLLGIVDCCSQTKTLKYIDRLRKERANNGIVFDGVAFVCATHPHYDHIRGIEKILRTDSTKPDEFWDSGFRHISATYCSILKAVTELGGIQMLRVTSGMEWYFGTARITALAPSVALRNRYATYGIDMNNASIVLRFENCTKDTVTIESTRYEAIRDPEIERQAGRSVVILGGDAEFASFARIDEEYPLVVRTSAHDPLVKKMVNLLNCSVVKVSHHGSMHSAPLDIYERMSPSVAVISSRQRESSFDTPDGPFNRNLFPHTLTEAALEETKTRILTTDGSYETAHGLADSQEGTVIVSVSPGKTPVVKKLKDSSSALPGDEETLEP